MVKLVSGLFISIIFFSGLFLACSTTARIGNIIQQDELKDGIYAGSFKGGLNLVKVKVTILDQKIVHIEVIEHDNLKGEKAELIIPKIIIERQSTYVDAVSGATNSSHVIMNAVQKAIEEAYISR